MDLTDKDGNATATGPVGPDRLRWTYLYGYGKGSRYSADMHPQDGTDSVYFLRVGEPVPYEAKDRMFSLDFGTKDDVRRKIQELEWLLKNWGEVGRD